MLKDYYAILQVSPLASGQQIRASFKRMALRHHPDRNVSVTPSADDTAAGGVAALHTSPIGSGDDTVDFADVREAYEVLSDVARRYLYDLHYAEILLQQQQHQYQAQWEKEKEEEAERARQREHAASAAAAAAAQRQAESQRVASPQEVPFDHAKRMVAMGSAALTSDQPSPTSAPVKDTLTPVAAGHSSPERVDRAKPRSRAADESVAAAVAVELEQTADRRTTTMPTAPSSHKQRKKLRYSQPGAGVSREADETGLFHRTASCSTTGTSLPSLPSLSLPTRAGVPFGTIVGSPLLTSTRGSGSPLGRTLGTAVHSLPAAKPEVYYHRRAAHRALTVFFAQELGLPPNTT